MKNYILLLSGYLLLCMCNTDKPRKIALPEKYIAHIKELNKVSTAIFSNYKKGDSICSKMILLPSTKMNTHDKKVLKCMKKLFDEKEDQFDEFINNYPTYIIDTSVMQMYNDKYLLNCKNKTYIQYFSPFIYNNEAYYLAKRILIPDAYDPKVDYFLILLSLNENNDSITVSVNPCQKEVKAFVLVPGKSKR